MDTSRAAREIFVPYPVPAILPETQRELDGQAALLDSSAQPPARQPGDVLDGSVDYYDFDWGQETAYGEDTIFSGCRQNDTCYTACGDMPPCGGQGDPGTPDPPCLSGEGCAAGENLPAQQDNPGYETVEP